MQKTINIKRMSKDELEQQKGNCQAYVELIKDRIDDLLQASREGQSIVKEIERELLTK